MPGERLLQNLRTRQYSGRLIDLNLEGVGFHFRVNKDNTVGIEKKVYRKYPH
jgi:hypothetical protein